MPKDIDIRMDFANSWFILAQILAVIAGLFMVAAGFLITPPSQEPSIYLNALELCEKIKSSTLNNLNERYKLDECLKEYGDYYGTKIRIAAVNGYLLFFLSLALVLDSIICWLRGRWKIRHHLSEDAHFGKLFLLFNIFVILNILLWSMYIIGR